MISSEYRALVFLLTRSCKPVAFIWKSKTYQPTKAVATKVENSIGSDPVPLIQWAILAIFFPKFSMYCTGSSVSLIFKGLDKHTNGRRFDLFLFLDNGSKHFGSGGVVLEFFFNSFPDL